MNSAYPVIPIILALGAFVSGAVYWVMARRRHQESDLDTTAFLLVGAAWIIIGLVFEHANLGSFGSVLILTGMGLGLYRRFPQGRTKER
jgi:drug/metabolite transporter (DMT)-like permease